MRLQHSIEEPALRLLRSLHLHPAAKLVHPSELIPAGVVLVLALIGPLLA